MPVQEKSKNEMCLESNYYPFSLKSPLCPLIGNPDLLLEFYDTAGFRQSIKQFCKRHSWRGKPSIPHSIGSDQLKLLLKSLFNSFEAREKLNQTRSSRRYRTLDGAIWYWLRYKNKPLADDIEQFGFIDDDITETHNMLNSFLEKITSERPGIQLVRHLAYFVLAYAMFKPSDRYELGKVFINHFPNYKSDFCLYEETSKPSADNLEVSDQKQESDDEASSKEQKIETKQE